MKSIQKTVNCIPSDTVIFKKTKDQWSEPIKCNGGCGHNIIFNSKYCGNNGRLIPFLQPDRRHYCPTNFKNFRNLSQNERKENEAL